MKKEQQNSSILENSENEEKPKKGKKLRVSKSGIKKYNSQSNNSVRIKSEEFERSEGSSCKKQQKLYSEFLYAKKFKLSNEFDAKHSQKIFRAKR